jgi:hypothetical protein
VPYPRCDHHELIVAIVAVRLLGAADRSEVMARARVAAELDHAERLVRGERHALGERRERDPHALAAEQRIDGRRRVARGRSGERQQQERERTRERAAVSHGSLLPCAAVYFS